MKYKTAESVCEALLYGRVTRESMMVMKRRHYGKMNDSYALLLERGIEMFDNGKNEHIMCSYYNKPINNLTLIELVELEENKKEMFTNDHAKKYSLYMFGGCTNIEDYTGLIITPREIREL